MRRAAAGQSIIKIAVTASAGAAMEWYDFFIYGTAAALVYTSGWRHGIAHQIRQPLERHQQSLQPFHGSIAMSYLE
jgi:hypothetical protein